MNSNSLFILLLGFKYEDLQVWRSYFFNVCTFNSKFNLIHRCLWWPERERVYMYYRIAPGGFEEGTQRITNLHSVLDRILRICATAMTEHVCVCVCVCMSNSVRKEGLSIIPQMLGCFDSVMTCWPFLTFRNLCKAVWRLRFGFRVKGRELLVVQIFVCLYIGKEGVHVFLRLGLRNPTCWSTDCLVFLLAII